MFDKFVFIILGVILATVLGQVVCYFALYNSAFSQAFDNFTGAVNISDLGSWMHGSSGLSFLDVFSGSFKNIVIALFSPVALVAIAGYLLRVGTVIFYTVGTAIAYLLIAASVGPSLLNGGGDGFVVTLAGIAALGAICGLFYWGIFGRIVAFE